MENTVETPVKPELDMSKFPALQFEMNQLDLIKKQIDKLDKRKSLIRDNWENLTEFEKNEREILEISTEFTLQKKQKQVKQREKMIKDDLKNINDHIDEVHEKYHELNQTALTKYTKNDEVQEFMAEADLEIHETNWDFKMHHYFQLKSLLNNSGKIKKISQKRFHK